MTNIKLENPPAAVRAIAKSLLGREPTHYFKRITNRRFLKSLEAHMLPQDINLVSRADLEVRSKMNEIIEARRKVALNNIFRNLKGVQAISLYLIEAGRNKMFYSVGTPQFFLETTPEMPVFMHKKHIFIFGPNLSSSNFTRFDVPASDSFPKSLFIIPLSHGGQQHGMLVIEGLLGMFMSFNGTLNPLLFLDYLQYSRLTISELLLCYFDKLTGLLNRTAFEMEIVPSIHKWVTNYRNKMPFALLMVDLNNFKPVNDQFGHPEGDLALIEYAHLLAAKTRSHSINSYTYKGYSDFLFRLGGDEFGVLMLGVPYIFSYEIAMRLKAETTLLYNGIKISPSIGVLHSEYLINSIRQDATLEEVDAELKIVDQALLIAKTNKDKDGLGWIDNNGKPVFLQEPPKS